MKHNIRPFVLAAALFAAAAASAADSESRFARITETADGRPAALQMAIVRYRGPGGGASVDLVGAIHIAEPGYYAALNRRFDTYDALLYELVAAEAQRVPVRGSEREGFVSGTQVAMTGALGLSFQLDEIDYDKPHFRHADLSPQLLRERMSERGESLYVYFWRLFFMAMEEYARDPLGTKSIPLYSALLSNDRQAIKTALAWELVDVDRHSRFLAGESGSAIIESRNERAIEVVAEALADGERRIGLFYGVAHMPDLEQRLVGELGFERVATEWLDAWYLAADDSPE